MSRIVKEIVGVRRAVSGGGRVYYVATIVDDQGDESDGYLLGVGDKVEVFFHEKYNKAKFQKSKP